MEMQWKWSLLDQATTLEEGHGYDCTEKSLCNNAKAEYIYIYSAENLKKK
jgi:hypothetical protein